MARRQCPNCGGYKTYRWASMWLSDVLYKVMVGGFMCGVAAMLGGVGLALVPMLLVAVVVVFKVLEFAVGPAKKYACEICDFNWNPGETPPTGKARPNLVEMGNALLERQRAAAESAAEDERYQEEQRRWYAGT